MMFSCLLLKQIIAILRGFYAVISLLSFINKLIYAEHIGHVVRISVSGYKGCRFEPWHLYVVSLSVTLYPHHFNWLNFEMNTMWDDLMKDFQCYELFGGIAHKYAFFDSPF